MQSVVVCGWSVFVLPWAVSGLSAETASAPVTAEVDLAALRQGLHSSSFIQRDWATRHLMHAGPAAVAALKQSILQLPPETGVAPEVRLLQEMSQSSDSALAAAAIGALIELHERRSDLPEPARRDVEDGYQAAVRHALGRLTAWGARVARDPSGQVVRIRVHSSRFGDPQMSLLAAVSTLRELDLQGTQVTGAGLSRLSSLSALEQLNLTDTPLANGDLRQLPALPNLKRIALYRVDVSEDDLEWLQTQFPDCEVRLSR